MVTHRRLATLKAGITAADVHVGEFDDHAIIRVYARETATQRGNTGTAMAGAVASAIRFLSKGILTGTLSQIRDKPVDVAKARGHLTSDDGLGERLILEFLEGIPGINKGSVWQQLANLKGSGDYARIIGEVQADIEREERCPRCCCVSRSRMFLRLYPMRQAASQNVLGFVADGGRTAPQASHFLKLFPSPRVEKAVRSPDRFSSAEVAILSSLNNRGGSQ